MEAEREIEERGILSFSLKIEFFFSARRRHFSAHLHLVQREREKRGNFDRFSLPPSSLTPRGQQKAHLLLSPLSAKGTSRAALWRRR